MSWSTRGFPYRRQELGVQETSRRDVKESGLRLTDVREERQTALWPTTLSGVITT
jgi:hypothetical protein